ncbi:ChbG/HpnK family deacetylase [Candidatus Fermentibacteria bacterium]|nr:ChbG/HpnK family deacetylase [Candidatus Fermentibacteria bacterium]
MREAGVFVSVDDAGLDCAIDEAVAILAREGAIDGISVLASAPGAAGAVATAAETGLAVSAHLDCLQLPFLSGGPRPRAAGLFAASSRWVSGIEREWRMQIERLERLGASLSGLDSHRHVHHLPALQGLSLRLAAEHGIGLVRAAILPDRHLRFPAGLVLDMLGRRLARKAESLGIRTRASMAGFGASGRVTRRYLERLKIPPGECELVMHPAVRPVWSDGQPSELALMRTDWFRKWTSAGA